MMSPITSVTPRGLVMERGFVGPWMLVPIAARMSEWINLNSLSSSVAAGWR